MRLKSFLLVCGLSLAVVLGGCGKADEKEPAKDSQTTVNTDSEIKNDVKPDTNSAAQTETSSDNNQDTQPENAASDVEAEALQAYQDILRSAPVMKGDLSDLYDLSFGYDDNIEKFGEHYDSFALADLNKDGIPELITVSTINVRWNVANVFTYADGKATLIANTVNNDFVATFNQNSGANGAYLLFICDENHIHNYWSGTDPIGEPVDENYAYTLAGTSLEMVDCSISGGDTVTYYNDIGLVNSEENVAAITK